MRKTHTFDIFDTLVARRCIQPVQVFLEIERDTQVENFAKIRTQAEAKVAKHAYTLDDIYQEIVMNFGVSQELGDYLKTKEVACEIHNAIAIQENLDKVHDGDVLITDMYLPRYAIEAILKKAGLRKHVGLIISSNGKHSGEIWPKIKNAIHIEQHTGDNQHSDVNSPLSHGVFGVHLTDHQMSAHESFLEQNGLGLLARAVRETRLKASSSNLSRQQRDQRMLQINCNMPMLILICAHIRHISQAQSVDQVLFSSRDCYMLERVFHTISTQAHWPEKSHYFLTSRVARLNASSTYLQYFKSLCSNDSMVVDLCGTGWSLGQLYAQSNIQPRTYLIHYLRDDSSTKQAYESIRSSRAIDKLLYLNDDKDINNVGIELVNYNPAGMFLNMLSVDGYDSTIPEFENPNYPACVTHAIDEMQTTQELFMQTLHNYDLAAMMKEIDNKSSQLSSIFAELYKNLCANLGCMQDVFDYHTKQDAKSMWRLKNASHEE